MWIKKTGSVLAIVLVTIVIISFAVDRVEAQGFGQKEPDMNELMSQMGPMMGNMMEVMMDRMFGLLAKPDTANRLAKFSYNYYVSLQAQGFSKEEAMRIMTSQGFPSFPSAN